MPPRTSQPVGSARDLPGAIPGAVLPPGKPPTSSPASGAAPASRAAPSSRVSPVILAPGSRPEYWPRACQALSAADPRMAAVIDAWGSAHLVSRGDPFVTLARSIVGQQISVKAAQVVWSRFEKAAGTVVPARIARMRLTTLARCGLSTRKAEYVRDLACRFVGGEVDPVHWPGLDDEAVIAELVRVRGIGRWTAEMFLIFNLLRPDVLPVDDLGLLKAVSINYNEGRPVSKAETVEIARRWQPWRTVATWYLWRSLDPLPVEY